MEINATFVVAVLLLVFSCNPSQEQTIPDSSVLQVVETKGYRVPRDSITEPVEFPAGKPQIIKAGNPKVVLGQSNVHAAGQPKLVAAGTPKKRIPGVQMTGYWLFVPGS